MKEKVCLLHPYNDVMGMVRNTSGIGENDSASSCPSLEAGFIIEGQR